VVPFVLEKYKVSVEVVPESYISNGLEDKDVDMAVEKEPKKLELICEENGLTASENNVLI
jgi:hypothetical protein